VLAREPGRRGGVAPLDRGDDLGHLGHGLLAASGPRQRGRAQIGDPRLQRVEHLPDHAVARPAEQHPVEVVLARHHLGQAALPDGVLDRREARRELLDLRVVRALGEAARGERLERRARVVDLGGLVAGDRGDDRAAVGDHLDQALALELAQRLAHRSAAHAGQLAQLPLDQALTGGEAAGEDRLADVVEHLRPHRSGHGGYVETAIVHGRLGLSLAERVYPVDRKTH